MCNLRPVTSRRSVVSNLQKLQKYSKVQSIGCCVLFWLLHYGSQAPYQRHSCSHPGTVQHAILRLQPASLGAKSLLSFHLTPHQIDTEWQGEMAVLSCCGLTSHPASPGRQMPLPAAASAAEGDHLPVSCPDLALAACTTTERHPLRYVILLNNRTASLRYVILTHAEYTAVFYS